MPIKIPNDLPATKVLTQENIFVMTENRAITQDIRPLQILLLNLMPTKIDTETQLCRLLSNSPLQVEPTFITTDSYTGKNTPVAHLSAFYKHFSDVKDRKFDGMIITGAPVEHMAYEDVAYWKELCEIMEWTKSHVHSTFHICWAAQAALYYHFGINKTMLSEKLFGVFKHTLEYKKSILFRGFDDVFYVPHSRNSTFSREELAKCPELKILASSEKAGVYAVSTKNGRQIFITGHSEYDAETLKREYERDVALGKDIHIPENYFPNDDPTQKPMVTWRSSATMMFANWLNYYVYQATPYDINEIKKI